MTPRKHVVITGTGRAGTTFLVQLITYLGFDTGLSPDDPWKAFNNNARAGIESDILSDDAPYIVKSPAFATNVHKVIARDDIEIEHIFIPMRDLTAAAESRRHVVQQTLRENPAARPSEIIGGLRGTDNPQDQEIYLLRVIYHLLFHVSNTNIPITLLRYPRLVQDSRYLYQKLAPILGDKVQYDDLNIAFQKLVRPEWVHQFTDQDL